MNTQELYALYSELGGCKARRDKPYFSLSARTGNGPWVTLITTNHFPTFALDMTTLLPRLEGCGVLCERLRRKNPTEYDTIVLFEREPVERCAFCNKCENDTLNDCMKVVCCNSCHESVCTSCGEYVAQWCEWYCPSCKTEVV